MATQSPFFFLDGLRAKIAEGVRAPQWLVHEAQHRGVLFLNHVLMQESEATSRLARQKGKVVRAEWGAFSAQVEVTPAGLLDLAPEGTPPDLHIRLTDTSPVSVAKAAMRGGKPTIRIDGDVQLAAEINWLADNVRWDVEEDLARAIGDAPAHAIAGVARRVADALRGFLSNRRSGSTSTAPDADSGKGAA